MENRHISAKSYSLENFHLVLYCISVQLNLYNGTHVRNIANAINITPKNTNSDAYKTFDTHFYAGYLEHIIFIYPYIHISKTLNNINWAWYILKHLASELLFNLTSNL